MVQKLRKCEKVAKKFIKTKIFFFHNFFFNFLNKFSTNLANFLKKKQYFKNCKL